MVHIMFQIQYKLYSINNISISKENYLDSVSKNKQNGSVRRKPLKRVQVVQEFKLIHLYI